MGSKRVYYWLHYLLVVDNCTTSSSLEQRLVKDEKQQAPIARVRTPQHFYSHNRCGFVYPPFRSVILGDHVRFETSRGNYVRTFKNSCHQIK